MVSRRALDDFDTFLGFGSGALRSGGLNSTVDVSEDTFDALEAGDVRFGENVDCFLVLVMGRASFLEELLTSSGAGSANALLNDGLGLLYLDDTADKLLLPPFAPILAGMEPLASPLFAGVFNFVF